MSLLPKRLEIELTEQDVEKDLVKIVDSMNSLRREAIDHRKVRDDVRDEYLHLVYRLASVIENIDRGEKLVPRMQELVNAVDKKRKLLNYDPLQRQYWQRKNPNFLKKLDAVLISVLKDNLVVIDSAHHIWNAVKYLAADENERKDIIGTIAPFSPPVVEEYWPDSFMEEFWRPVPEHFSEMPDDLTLKVDGKRTTAYLFDDVTFDAVERGYKFLQKNSRVSFHVYKNAKPLEEAVTIESHKISDLCGDLIRKTKPVSSAILGNLPGIFADKLEKKYGKDVFDAGKSVGLSAAVNACLGMVFAYSLYVTGVTGMSAMQMTGVTVAYLTLSFLARCRGIMKSRPIGSIPGYLIFGTPALASHIVAETPYDKKAMHPVEIDLHPQDENCRYPIFDRFKDVLASKPRSKLKTIVKTFHKLNPSAYDNVEEESVMDGKTLQACYYADSVGDYKRATVLASPGKDFYLLSLVHLPENGQEPKHALNSMARTISGSAPIEKKLEKLGEKYGLLYARISHFARGKELGSAEAFD